jgi:hypothetical protein
VAKTRVDVEEVLALLKRREEINALDIGDIEWHEGGKPLTVHPDVLKHYRFVGLGNTGFVEMELYKEVPCQQFMRVIRGEPEGEGCQGRSQ